MIFAQISDSHCAPDGELIYGFVDMNARLERTVDHINALSLRPDLVLHTGDVTHNATIPEARAAKTILDRLECPYYVVPGNHDTRDTLWDVFGGAAIPSMKNGFLTYAVDTPTLRFLAMDSIIEGADGGALCDQRAHWLETHLNARKNFPVVIFQHQPPHKCGVPESDIDGFEGADRLGAIIARNPNIERILCGHIHRTTYARWKGTIVATAPSLGMELNLDLSQMTSSQFRMSDPSYLLHHWHNDSGLITHHIAVKTPPGPYAFANIE